MSYNEIDKKTLFKVGFLTIGVIVLIGVFSVLVNDRPFWWRGCQPIYIAVEDATGLKTKSPVRSLGLQIGYLKSVELSEMHVKLGICVTAPVEILDQTRAYVRGEGFLGDKFVELKPVKYTGTDRVNTGPELPPAAPEKDKDGVPSSSSGTSRTPDGMIQGEILEEEKPQGFPLRMEGAFNFLQDILIPSALAQDEPAKQVPVGRADGDMDKIMQQADVLLREMTDLTKNLKEGLNPAELRSTIQQLNTTLQNASKVLAPEGNLNQTARRSLLKLEEAFEQLRQQMTKINNGEGSLGRLLNDPVYADELLKAAKNLNKLLGRTTEMRFNIDVYAEQIPVYDGGRGVFHLKIYPAPSRYYHLGISIDPRGKRQVTNTITTSGGQETRNRTEQIEEGGLLLTGMLGKIFYDRIDLSAGALHGDGAVSLALLLGPSNFREAFIFRNDVYSRGQGISLNDRITVSVRPLGMFTGLESVYIKGGMESVRKVNGKYAFLFGAGVSFDDEDIKLLFALR